MKVVLLCSSRAKVRSIRLRDAALKSATTPRMPPIGAVLALLLAATAKSDPCASRDTLLTSALFWINVYN